MKHTLLLLGFVIFSGAAISQTTNQVTLLKNFFSISGSSTLADWAHPFDDIKSSETTVTVYRTYVKISISYDSPIMGNYKSVYTIDYTATGKFTDIFVYSEGSLVSSFKNCDIVMKEWSDKSCQELCLKELNKKWIAQGYKSKF